uniref:Uncharacterized protein n=1 Tax=Molossus molossus TaxID=27622 RepID=A0A7J8HCK9_MOLMO|nr:hypothetical protein HJG59_011167 [Molossus molossus]
MHRALTCEGVRSPPSAPGDWGAALAAFSSSSATRKYHLRRRFTPSRPDVGCEFWVGEWARQLHASAASSYASTSSSRGGGDTRWAPRKWLGLDNSRPRASRTLRPAGTGGGARRRRPGCGSVGAANMRSWVEGGGCFRGDGGGVAFLSLWRWI